MVVVEVVDFWKNIQRWPFCGVARCKEMVSLKCRRKDLPWRKVSLKDTCSSGWSPARCRRRPGAGCSARPTRSRRCRPRCPRSRTPAGLRAAGRAGRLAAAAGSWGGRGGRRGCCCSTGNCCRWTRNYDEVACCRYTIRLSVILPDLPCASLRWDSFLSSRGSSSLLPLRHRWWSRRRWPGGAAGPTVSGCVGRSGSGWSGGASGGGGTGPAPSRTWRGWETH